MGFRCLKSVGWDWEKTQRTDPDRVARHWLAMAVATAWARVTGSGEETEGEDDRRGERTVRRRVSLFRRGLALLQRQLYEGRLKPWPPLIPEPWPDLSSCVQIHRHLPHLC